MSARARAHVVGEGLGKHEGRTRLSPFSYDRGGERAVGGQTGNVSMVHERPETVFVRKEWAMGADRHCRRTLTLVFFVMGVVGPMDTVDMVDERLCPFSCGCCGRGGE